MSTHRIFGCKWDFCTLAFKTLPDLDHHLQSEHVAHARKEECHTKRRKIAKGVYIKLSSQPLADQLPLRLSQTTGDITTTTTTDLTFSTDSPLYPPSFPSQPPTLPSLDLFQAPVSEDMDLISLYTHGGSPSNSPPAPTSHLPTTQTQFDLPSTSSPFEPPTQAFQDPTTQSTQSSHASSQSTGKTKPFPHPPGFTSRHEKSPVSSEDARRKRTSSGNSIPLSFGQSPARHGTSSAVDKDGRKISGGSEWSMSSESVTFSWGLGSSGKP